MLSARELQAIRDSRDSRFEADGLTRLQARQLMAHIDALTEALASERALADDLAKALADELARDVSDVLIFGAPRKDGAIDTRYQARQVLARHRAARTP